MAQPNRNEFAPGAEGDKLFQEAMKAFKQAESTLTLPKTHKQKYRLLGISEAIVSEREGTESVYRVLDLISPEGEATSLSIGEAYYATAGRRLRIGTPYQFEVETRIEGKTGYVDRTTGEMLPHKTSSIQLVRFQPLTDSAFGEKPNLDVVQAQVDLMTQAGQEFQASVVRLLELQMQERIQMEALKRPAA